MLPNSPTALRQAYPQTAVPIFRYQDHRRKCFQRFSDASRCVVLSLIEVLKYKDYKDYVPNRSVDKLKISNFFMMLQPKIRSAKASESPVDKTRTSLPTGEKGDCAHNWRTACPQAYPVD